MPPGQTLPVPRPTLSRVARPRGEKLIADNRRARHEYELLDRVEAGLVLQGTEVKALREGRATIERAFADVRGGEIWLVGANIAAYDKGGFANHDPERDRLRGRVQEQGLTLVPTRLYFKDGKAKIELALGRGKQVRDKRRDISRREADRQIERALKDRNR